MNAEQITREAREVPITDLLEPELPSRIAMDDEKMDELTASIARDGLIQRLIVWKDGEKLRIAAGHRRYIACKRAGLPLIPVDIFPSERAAMIAVQYAENRFREDLSAAEEAYLFGELLDKECDGDIDKLAGLVGEKVSYVDNRLQLFQGDREVLAALETRAITIGVAHLLNTVTDDDVRRHYLKHAAYEGSSVAVVTGWVTQWRASKGAPSNPEPQPAATAPIVAPAYDPHFCVACRRSVPGRIPRLVSIHDECMFAIVDPLLRAYHGEGDGPTQPPNDPRRV